MAKRSLIVAATLLLSNAIALAQIAGPPGQDSRAPGYGTPHSPRNGGEIREARGSGEAGSRPARSRNHGPSTRDLGQNASGSGDG